MFRTSNQHGFTIVELVVVIIVLGIISAVAVPRFFDLNDYKEIAFKDELVSALRFAHKRAVASGEKVEIKITPTEPYINIQSLGTTIKHPAGDDYKFTEIHPKDAPPSNIPLKNETISFDALGRADSTFSPGDFDDPPISNVGYNSSGITIWRETGCVEVN